MGDFEDLAGWREIRRLSATPSTRPATSSPTDHRHAVANATLDLPDVLIDQEVEVMHDEFRGRSPGRGSARRHLKVTGKSDADLHTDLRPDAEKRAVLLVLSKVAGRA
jgi:FKBP-type peptidyl-prolyl cis-trans isomerase (trigger factor)